MNFNDKKWAIAVLSFLAGAFVATVLVFYYKNHKEYDDNQDLGIHYIEFHSWTIFSSMVTIEKVEKGELESILSDQRGMLRDAFIKLTDIHKTSRYIIQDTVMRKYLKMAKNFMAKRPEQFIEQNFITTPSLTYRMSKYNVDKYSANNKITSARKNLQDAFDYVDTLSSEGITPGTP